MAQTFETIAVAGIATFFLNVIVSPLAAYVTQRITGERLDAFERKREDEQKKRDAERAIVLAIARTMLLHNYERCVEKGFYSVEEREVYGKLFAAYTADGGNGVIAAVAERIRKLPLRPDKQEVKR